MFRRDARRVPRRPAGREEQTWSLRTEWSRAFAATLAFLLVAAAATIFGITHLVSDAQGSGRRLDTQTAAVSALRQELVDHEETGHRILSNTPVDLGAYTAQQQRIAQDFAGAAELFPKTAGLRARVERAGDSWRAGLIRYGLWIDASHRVRANHAVDNPAYGASSDDTASILDGLEAPSLQAMSQALDRGTTVEHRVILGLGLLFALTIGSIAYFRRRMKRDLVSPVALMHAGVRQLHAGDYGHRIPVVRRDELGALAEAFNGLAGALHESHLALSWRAFHDSLTGLPNRAALYERMAAAFASPPGTSAGSEALLFIDIDDFKRVNDSVGHAGGDRLLVELAARLATCVRPTDLLARLGGDEFALVVTDGGVGDAAAAVARRVLEAMGQPFFIEKTSLQIAVSIGIAHRRSECTEAADMLRDADFAMYVAKGAGKNRFEVFGARAVGVAPAPRR